MASFDITIVAGQAYRKFWVERYYLLRMAMLPFAIKLACFTVLASMEGNPSFFMTGIILLPSFFVEGWLLSHWARTIMTGTHRWPFRTTGHQKKDQKELVARARGIMAGTVSFALINFLITGYFAVLFPDFPAMMESFNPENPDPRIAVMGSIFMITSLLLFRFVWVYIPISVNLSLNDILGKLKPISLTFQMLGLWLVCVVPAILILQLVGEVVHNALDDTIATAILLTVRIAIEIIKNLICTAGMAYMFLFLFKKTKT